MRLIRKYGRRETRASRRAGGRFGGGKLKPIAVAVVTALLAGFFGVLQARISSLKGCVAGEARECKCGTGSSVQYCKPDGAAFDRCECGKRGAYEPPPPTTAETGADFGSLSTTDANHLAQTFPRDPRDLAPTIGAAALITRFRQRRVGAIGAFATDCSFVGDTLLMTVSLSRYTTPNSYGGCCVAGSEPLDLSGPAKIRGTWLATRAEPKAEVKFERTDNRIQEPVHATGIPVGRSTFSGDVHETAREVGRICFVLHGVGDRPHDTAVTIENIGFAPL